MRQSRVNTFKVLQIDKQNQEQGLTIREFVEAEPSKTNPIGFTLQQAKHILYRNTRELIPLNRQITFAADQKNTEVGMFLQSTLFSHSCTPNCTMFYIGTFCVIIANQDISKGDKITVSYL